MLRINTQFAKQLGIKCNLPSDKRINKYRSIQAIEDGYKFDSKLEANYYRYLKLMQKMGDVSYFLMQVPIKLCPKRRIVVDFQVFYKDGTHAYIDTKGVETTTFKVKKDIVENLYPIEIRIVKRGEF